MGSWIITKNQLILFEIDNLSCPASQYGLTAWRILSGYPHYNLIEDEGTKLFRVILFFENPIIHVVKSFTKLTFIFTPGLSHGQNIHLIVKSKQTAIFHGL